MSLSFRLPCRIRRIDWQRRVGTYPHNFWSRKTTGRCRRETDEDSPPTDVPQQRSPANACVILLTSHHLSASPKRQVSGGGPETVSGSPHGESNHGLTPWMFTLSQSTEYHLNGSVDFRKKRLSIVTEIAWTWR